MIFTGRERETKKIIGWLEEGKNIVLTGKFGIGRSSLVRHVARKTSKRWRFVFMDFSQTPGTLSRQLMRDLFAGNIYDRKTKVRGYKSNRFRIVHMKLKDIRQHILVLDDIVKLTPQKLAFLRYLSDEKRFRFIAIVDESSLGKALFHLRATLLPSETLALRHMKIDDTLKVFRHFCAQHNLGWYEDHIRSLSELSGGYPLGIREILERKLKSRQKHPSMIEDKI